jgi:hypothetical protein
MALEAAIESRKQAESKIVVQQKQARYLAAALRAARQSLEKPDQVDETQMDTLISGAEGRNQLSDLTES